MKSRAILFLLLGTATSCFALESLPTIAAARTIASAVSDEALRDELWHEAALVLTRLGGTAEALELGRTLSPFRQANVLLAVAARLPSAEKARAEQLLLDAQTDRVLTHDWHKARLSRLLAIAHAQLGHFETAEAMAREIPDIEDRAFALAGVVAEFSRAGEIAKARELAGSIEENRRYGTYRQKAAALSAVARILHARGDAEGATNLLAQAELLLPKKPGWSDGGAIIEVALAAHVCGKEDKARELLTESETIARAIGGAWKASELVHVADAWRTRGDAKHADALLQEAHDFLPTLPALDRAPEAVTVARAQAAAGFSDAARALLTKTLGDADRAEITDAWRAVRVRTMLASTEIFSASTVAKSRL
jgi:tetratricopeptide (TPR) repeat protein